MQAFGPGPPVLAGKALNMGPAKAFPGRDQFQALLQGRMVTHLMRGNSFSYRNRFNPVTGLPGARSSQDKSNRPVESDLRLRPERLPELAAVLLQAGFPPEHLNALLSEPEVQEHGLTLRELMEAWQRAAEEAGTEFPFHKAATPERNPETFSASTLSEPLLRLIAFLEETSTGTLAIPPSRQPEIASLLLDAGFSQDQVDKWLMAMGVKEQSLTTTDLKAALLKTLQENQPGEGDILGEPSPLSLTSLSDFQRVWQRLRLPAEAFPDLRLALQKLGVKPEALAMLEDHLNPQGIPVSLIWRVIKQCNAEALTKSEHDAAAPAQDRAALHQPLGGKEVERWRQLLLQTGLSPELVDELLEAKTPGNRKELLVRLLALAPADSSAQAQDSLKPLYLPENLRLRSLSWESHPSQKDNLPGQHGEPESRSPGSQTSETLGFPEGLQRGDTFPALQAALSQAHSVGGTTAASWSLMSGGPSYLTPEARQSFWNQIQEGIFSHLKPGEHRIKLVLEPPELGQIDLSLKLSGDRLEVTAVTTRPEVAHLAQSGLEHLAQALSQQGLILTQFQVQVQNNFGQPATFPVPGPRAGGRKEATPGEMEPAWTRRGTSQVDFFV